MDYESISCVRCGRVVSIPHGHMTEEGKGAFKCSTCVAREEMPMEARIAENKGSGKLLTEEMPVG